MKARVLMVTGEYPPSMGGVADYTALLAGELARLDTAVTVLTTRQAGSGTTPTAKEAVPVVRMQGAWGVSCWRQVAQAARACGASIVHLQYQAAAYGMHPAANLLPAYLRLRESRLRVVTTFHDLRVPYIFPKAGPLRRQAVLALDRWSHASVVTNRADLDSLGGPGNSSSTSQRRWLIPIGSNVQCCPPPGFDRQQHRAGLGVAGDTLLLSYFGFMNHSKGVSTLVEALKLLVDGGIDARLLVVGGDSGSSDPTNQAYSRDVEGLIQTLGLSGRVLKTGFVPPQEVSAALLASDLCVLPFRDGASLRRGSLIAAIAHGLAIVTTHPEKPEPMLEDAERLAMVPRDDPQSLAGAIERLWRDGGARERLSAGAAGLASLIRWPDIARRHQELYDSLS